MDILLPDEDAMRRMRQEFDKLNVSDRMRAVTSALRPDIEAVEAPSEPQNSLHMCKTHSGDDSSSLDENAVDGDASAPFPAISDAPDARLSPFPMQKAFAVAVLYLYFIRVLGYNIGYGTEIYDPRRGLGGLQPVSLPFGELNGLS